jgi:hypothetical protein
METIAAEMNGLKGHSRLIGRIPLLMGLWQSII